MSKDSVWIWREGNFCFCVVFPFCDEILEAEFAYKQESAFSCICGALFLLVIFSFLVGKIGREEEAFLFSPHQHSRHAKLSLDYVAEMSFL